MARHTFTYFTSSCHESVKELCCTVPGVNVSYLLDVTPSNPLPHPLLLPHLPLCVIQVQRFGCQATSIYILRTMHSTLQGRLWQKLYQQVTTSNKGKCCWLPLVCWMSLYCITSTLSTWCYSIIIYHSTKGFVK